MKKNLTKKLLVATLSLVLLSTNALYALDNQTIIEDEINQVVEMPEETDVTLNAETPTESETPTEAETLPEAEIPPAAETPTPAPKLPSQRAAVFIRMETNFDTTVPQYGGEDNRYTVVWNDDHNVDEPITVTVSQGAEIMSKTPSNIEFYSGNNLGSVYDLSVVGNKMTFKTTAPAEGQLNSVSFVVKAPYMENTFTIGVKVGSDAVPTYNGKNYIQRSFNVAPILTIETSASLIERNQKFDVYGYVRQNGQRPANDFDISLIVSNKATGEVVDELSLIDVPLGTAYMFGGIQIPSTYADGTYIVKATFTQNWVKIVSVTKEITLKTNTAPLTPVITRTPSGDNIGPNVQIKITAAATDPEGDALTYQWDGRLAESSLYPLGKNVVRVRAIDSGGLTSDWAVMMFFVTDPDKGGGMMLTGPDSVILEQGIQDFTMSKYTLTVPPVSGHSGADWGRVRGYNIKTGVWDQLDYGTTVNGITFSRTLPKYTYSQLEFYYYTNHNCMYDKSNITYSVSFDYNGN